MADLPTIRIEGGLLGPDVLDELLAGNLPGQRAADFGLGGRRNLTDEIAALFADARALWGIFQHRLQRLSADDLATGVTRDAWMVPLLGLLGYEPHFNPRAHDVDALTFAISHRAGEPEDAPPVHIVGARQPLGRVPPSGRPRMAPHSLLQEFLNRTEHVWGIVTNGQTLRLLRDCTFVRRQAYVEFDLPAIIEEQRFQDFAVLYRLLHRSRLPRGLADAGECLLEGYYAHSVEQGGRVRDHLRDGVEECLTLLANGFLRHPANDELRRRVAPECTGNERIAPEGLYRQLLVLVYRFLFLLVSEDRGLLSADPIYREHYSIARLRRLVDQHAAFTDHDDLWQSLRVLWLLFIKDQPMPGTDRPLAALLGLPVLNGDLFTPRDLDAFTLSNHDLLEAFWRLSWYQESRGSSRRRVNYAALDVEELGSVYESLLEFHPTIDTRAARHPVFSLVPGAGRKSTGSYYTPPELVSELIRSALDPVIRERLAAAPPREKEKALLRIRICDPACGSGHFLLAAARRVGKELARVRTGEDEPAPERMREAIRDAISHCIHGVDKNPLAVDLCRVALWLEGHTADKPLTFLDHRIRCGDSLVGVFDLNVLKDGIPDKAFEPLEGDDKATARERARRNREERSGRADLPWDVGPALSAFSRQGREVDAIADDSPAAIRRKRQLFESGHADLNWRRQKLACDLWTGAFFQSLTPQAPVVTSGALVQHLAGRPIDPRAQGLVGALSEHHHFFHWPLEFPEVFADGGFDVILSNPPWERVKLQEQEFFAARDPEIALAANKAARAKLIKVLPEKQPALYREFLESLRAASGASAFFRHGGRFPLTGRGDINTYAVFAELGASLPLAQGRTGLILPKGIATDDTTKFFFASLVEAGRLIDLVGFENEDFIFPAVDHRVTFCKITLGGGARRVESSRIGFYVRRFTQLGEESRFFHLEKGDFWLLNPNTGNCPIFRSQADAELTKAIYRRVPILWREATESQPEVNPWRVSFARLFDMANDSHHFRTKPELESTGYRLKGNVFVGAKDRYLPLFEAKMLHQFDHRFSTYEGATQSQLNVGILPQPTAEQKRNPAFVVQPRYWVQEDVVESAIPKYPEPLALALAAEHRPSIQHVLGLWAAGYHLEQGNSEAASRLLDTPPNDLDRAASRAIGSGRLEEVAASLQRDYPLTAADVQAIDKEMKEPEKLARELVERFSPKWFLGWRDIARSTDQRTLLAGLVPLSAVGHKFQLMFSPLSAQRKILLEAILDSMVVDYCARQKLGGTSFSYFVIRQLPIAPPSFCQVTEQRAAPDLRYDLFPLVLELVYTAHDLAPLAEDCDYDGPPFIWDEARRFEIRCELDAAFFHLYLPAESTGEWRPAAEETPEQLAALQKHFPRPRDAVDYILDTFPQVRQKDEEAHGSYRTKERILAIYDAMLEAQCTGQPYQSTLNPPPGSRP
ncbi:MAG: N-6 DNA methylase [Gemmataceae bacterium]|nr:N-6 DNA methylase [Gemmataceae bacterium]